MIIIFCNFKYESMNIFCILKIMLTNFRALTCLHKQANMFNQFIYRLDLLALFFSIHSYIISWMCCGQIHWYFVTEIVLTYCEKKMFYQLRKTFEIRGWRRRICKIFEITRTIYSNIERPEQFLVTECFFYLLLEVSHI